MTTPRRTLASHYGQGRLSEKWLAHEVTRTNRALRKLRIAPERLAYERAGRKRQPHYTLGFMDGDDGLWETVLLDEVSIEAATASARGLRQMAEKMILDQERGPEVVCLCGSTRFMDAFHAENRRLSLEGRIVLTVEIVTYDGATDPQRADPDQKAMLDLLHLRKIDLADRVHVLNVGGYIGPSTRTEVEYAKRQGKAITYLEEA